MKRQISSIDRFGAEVKISFNQMQYHTTCWGGIFTMIMLSLVSYGISHYSEDLIYRRSPQTIYSQETVLSPERIVVTKKTFTVSFGIEDTLTWDHIIDTSLYSVTALNRKRYKTFNQTSNEYDFEEVLIDLNPQVCQQNQFQVPNTQDYYKNLAGIKQQYCFTLPDTTDEEIENDVQGRYNVNMEGDFTADIFSQIEIEFLSCKNKTAQEANDLISQGKEVIVCRPQSEIDLHLQGSYIGFYLTNQNFDPNNFDHPFSYAGTDLFWPVSNQLSKYISVLFKNTYIETNKGLFYNEVEIQKGFQYASDKEQVILQIDNRFAYVNLRFQKGQQDRIFRNYKSVGQVIAEIGGIATFLRILGFIIVYPISKLQLKKDIINQLFSFKQKYHRTQNNKKNTVTFKNTTQQIPNIPFKSNAGGGGVQNHYQSQDYNPEMQLPYIINGGEDANLNNKKQLFKLEEVEIFDKYPAINVKDISRNCGFSVQNFLATESNMNNLQKNSSNPQQNELNDIIINDSGDSPELRSGIKNNNQLPGLFINPQKISKPPKQNKYVLAGLGSSKHQLTQNLVTLNQANKQNEITENCIKNKLQKLSENNSWNNQIDEHERQYTAKNFKCKNQEEYYKSIFKPQKESIQLSLSEYLLFYFFPCMKRIKHKRNKIEYCNQIIQQQLDGVYILRKFLELEKLKAILLSEEQLKLFEYIPKPVIDEEIASTEAINASQSINKRQSSYFNKNSNTLQQSPQNLSQNVIGRCSSVISNLKSDSHQILNQHQFNILKLDQKSEDEKSHDAYQAFLQIKQKERLSKKDIKILKMIDPAFQYACDQTALKDQKEENIEYSPDIQNGYNQDRSQPVSLSQIYTNTTPYILNAKNKRIVIDKKRKDITTEQQEVNDITQSNSCINNQEQEQESESSPKLIKNSSNIDASAAQLYKMQFSIPLYKFQTKSVLNQKDSYSSSENKEQNSSK